VKQFQLHEYSSWLYIASRVVAVSHTTDKSTVKGVRAQQCSIFKALPGL
jgi:hypothetical protein